MIWALGRAFRYNLFVSASQKGFSLQSLAQTKARSDLQGVVLSLSKCTPEGPPCRFKIKTI